jgi:hypothetical protein
MTRGIARQWLVRMNVAPIRGIDNGTREAKRLGCAWCRKSNFAHERAGRLQCDKTPSRAESLQASHAAPPSAVCPLHMGEQFICPVLLRLSRPGLVKCLSVACCHKPHSIRLRRFPKISLPHSQRSPPQRPLQALCPHSCPRNSGSGHGSENQHLLEPPIHCQRPTYLNPYRSVLLFPPHFHPSPTAGRSSHHRSTLTSLVFLKLACCV